MDDRFSFPADSVKASCVLVSFVGVQPRRRESAFSKSNACSVCFWVGIGAALSRRGLADISHIELSSPTVTCGPAPFSVPMLWVSSVFPTPLAKCEDIASVAFRAFFSVDLDVVLGFVIFAFGIVV
jgi:hypothetical protein